MRVGRNLGAGDRAIGVMGGLVAGQGASIAAAVIGNRCAVVLPHNVDVEIHQALARDSWGNRTHAVRRVADRTGEAILRYVVAVLREAGISHDFAQIVTLGAHAIGSIEAEVWIGKRVRHQSSRSRGLAELIIVLEDVRVDRAVGTIRPEPAEFAIIVAVVAIAAENPDSHQPPCRAILIQHVGQQTGLRQRAQTIVGDGMA